MELRQHGEIQCPWAEHKTLGGTPLQAIHRDDLDGKLWKLYLRIEAYNNILRGGGSIGFVYYQWHDVTRERSSTAAMPSGAGAGCEGSGYAVAQLELCIAGIVKLQCR